MKAAVAAVLSKTDFSEPRSKECRHKRSSTSVNLPTEDNIKLTKHIKAKDEIRIPNDVCRRDE